MSERTAGEHMASVHSWLTPPIRNDQTFGRNQINQSLADKKSFITYIHASVSRSRYITGFWMVGSPDRSEID